MAFNVNDMLSAINGVGGLSKASKFLVTITPPASIFSASDRDFMFLCEAAQLPGINLQTDDIRLFGYGNTEKRPIGATFTDMPLTFFNDTDGKVLSFFHKWIQAIYNFNNGDNPNGTTSSLVKNSLAYPKEYYGTVVIQHFDDVMSDSDEPPSIVQYTLNNAFPITIADINVDWSYSDQLVRIPVTFTYKWWTADTMAPGDVDFRSQTRANALSYNQSRIENSYNTAYEVFNYVSPFELQRYTNYFATFLRF